MKRSSVVNLVLITSAAALTSCQEKPSRYCVDAYNQVTDQVKCQESQDHRNGEHWYYGGGHGFVARGTRLSGGSTIVPAQGFSTSAESGTARGMFGGAGEGAAGHGGGEGGGE